MAPLRAAFGLCLVAALDLGGADAQEVFDNPSGPGTVPCVVLNRFEVEPRRGPDNTRVYLANAMIENICGRAIDVRFCFLLAEPVDGVDRSCHQGPMRPWATSVVESAGAPVRITAPDYQWRYLQQ